MFIIKGCLHILAASPSRVYHCVNGDGQFDRVGSRPSTIDTMLNFDGDGHGDGACK